MILKIGTDRGVWRLWDNFDSIRVTPINYKNGEMGYGGATVDLRDTQKERVSPAKEHNDVELFKNGLFVERIITASPFYLLNSSGETIERF